MKNDGEKNSVKSIYNPCKKSMLIGQRIRLTWTISADGTVAAVYVSVLGLNSRELPVDTCPSGVLVLPIEGLAIGGVDPDCRAIGYVAFVRAEKDLEKQNFKHYQKMRVTSRILPSSESFLRFRFCPNECISAC